MNRVEKRREELLGKEFETNNCGKCFIIDYKGRQEVMVAFYEPFYILICALNKLKIGSVRNPLYPSAYGVGFCGVGNYNSHKDERLYDLRRRQGSTLGSMKNLEIISTRTHLGKL